jgi:large subunit ribosomal protein L28
MSKVCYICGKKPIAGRSIVRRGMAKKKGGVGKKITGVSNRVFYPNLQKIKIIIAGLKKTVRICTKCLKAGKVAVVR